MGIFKTCKSFIKSCTKYKSLNNINDDFSIKPPENEASITPTIYYPPKHIAPKACGHCHQPSHTIVTCSSALHEIARIYDYCVVNPHRQNIKCTEHWLGQFSQTILKRCVVKYFPIIQKLK